MVSEEEIRMNSSKKISEISSYDDTYGALAVWVSGLAVWVSVLAVWVSSLAVWESGLAVWVSGLAVWVQAKTD